MRGVETRALRWLVAWNVRRLYCPRRRGYLPSCKSVLSDTAGRQWTIGKDVKAGGGLTRS